MNFTAIDFETANASPTSICAVGIVVVENGEITQTLSELVKPTPNYYLPFHTSIHGITREDTVESDNFGQVWEKIRELLPAGLPLVAHNAAFDMGVLRATARNYDLPAPEASYYCTVGLSRLTFPGLVNYKLPTVVEHLELPVFRHHDALADADAAARIMLRIFEANDVEDFEELREKLGFRPGAIYPDGGYTAFSVARSTISRYQRSRGSARYRSLKSRY